MQRDTIAVLDFGSQYAHLIAKRIRHIGVYAEIFPPKTKTENLKTMKGIILSGGPASVFAEDIPPFNAEILSLDMPILGLCYGHQLIAQHFGGLIQNTGQGEFGKAFVEKVMDSRLWQDVSFPSQVWMSHQDSVTECPPEFERIGQSKHCPIVAMQHREQPVFTLQFHPEVKDSLAGIQILTNFVKQTEAEACWSMEGFVQEANRSIQDTVGSRKVLMFLSGGVDSSVAFALLNNALGKERVLGLFIDNGFLRKNEAETILTRYKQLGYNNIQFRDASEDFLKAIAGQVDPQKKRHLVGAAFIDVRDQFLENLNLNPEEWILGQGTLYPDIIESGGTEHSEVIKSHHNRVQQVKDLMEKGQVVEPLKELYKDEVRKVGELLGLPDAIVWRHPFPGPGLSINVLCAHGDEEFENALSLKNTLRQLIPGPEYKTDLLPVRSVGVQGDQRSYAQPAVLIGTQDWEKLEEHSIKITNEVRTINRVVTLLAPNELPSLKSRRAYCTKERLKLLQEVDALATQALIEHQLMQEIFQLLVIILPLSTNGTGNSIVLRPVCSEDVMTAQFAKIDWKIVNPLSHQILELPGIDAVFYDITHKPPATFGWE
ncbi:MAG: glutamine-hydrolyzing GMP synthase [SAR324 cluster bacterium]|nr:glutamine-hydrolyzing GMP synthase [SAR324 cluster bacterium]